MTEENCFEDEINSWIEKNCSSNDEVYLSIVIPAYNEQRRLPATLMELLDYLEKPKFKFEIIVVDDGSTDQTTEVVRRFERVNSSVRVIRLPINYGKGHAVRVGMLSAEGKYILFADADGATPWAEIERLFLAIKNNCDIAIGSRAKASESTAVITHFHRKLLGRIFNFLVNKIAVPNINDTQCGFKIFSQKAARFIFERQTANGFSFDVELLMIAQKVKMIIAEVPINWENVPGSKVSLIKDSLKMLADTLLFRFKHRYLTRDSWQQFQTHFDRKAS